MAGEMVTCARCKKELPQAEADFSADGMICSKCAVDAEVANRLGVSAVGKDTIADAERALLATKYRKHVLIGLGGVILGVPMTGGMLWAMSNGGASRGVGRGLVLSGFLAIAGIGELGRGLSGLARLRREKRGK
jgi:hypothetical protein